MQELKRRLTYRLLRGRSGHLGHVPLGLSSVWVRDRVQYGHVSLDCFPSLRTINMYPMTFVKRERHHVLQQHLGASPPLILRFHPSKCHAALIVPRDQGAIVLASILVLLMLKRFWWRVMLVILIFVAWLLVDLLCFVAYHLWISCCLCAVTFQSYASSCRIELVAQRQHPTSFMSSRSNLLWFALILRVCIISARLGLAKGLDDPVVY